MTAFRDTNDEKRTPDDFVWNVTDYDREFFEHEIESFLPDRIFDAHVHLCRFADVGEAVRGRWEKAVPTELSLTAYREHVTALHGKQHTDALCMGIVPCDDCAVVNAYVASQIAPEANCRAHFLVRPEDDAEWVRQEVKRLGMCGLKPYHTFVRESVGPLHVTFAADIPDYLPEPLMAVADREGWSVTIHLVKERGPADPANIHWIRHYCRTYPNAQLILAHVARAWNPSHAFDGFPKLKGLDNLWIDTSANCSPMATLAALRTFGTKRIMYGSDFWWSHIRGLSAYAGDGMFWIYDHSNYDFESDMHGRGPTIVGLEHLRAIKWACWSAGLSDSQVEDYFWGNAAGLFGLAQKNSLSALKSR